MKNITTLADELAETATRLTVHLPQYLPAIRDAQTGLPGAQTYGSRHVLGHYPDPTADAGIARSQGEDHAANDEERVRSLVIQALHHVAKAERILASYTAALIINDRAGIGRCVDCNRYCDGKDHRLSRYKTTDDMVCTACRVRRDRAA